MPSNHQDHNLGSLVHAAIDTASSRRLTIEYDQITLQYRVRIAIPGLGGPLKCKGSSLEAALGDATRKFNDWLYKR